MLERNRPESFKAVDGRLSRLLMGVFLSERRLMPRPAPRRLVDDLFVTPLITTRVAQQRLGVSHPTARSAIRALEEAGSLVQLDPNRRWGKVFSAQETYSAISGEDA